MAELKPCPFCNGKAETVVLCQGDSRIMVKVRCIECRIGFNDTVESGASHETLLTAIHNAAEAWNRRIDNG